MAERKKFIEVKVPILNTSIRVLGSQNTLNKKTIILDLSRRMKGKGLVMKLKIFKKDDELIAIPSKLEITKSYIRKIIRKRVDYVEDSFITKCADIRAIVKPLLITRRKVSRAVRKNLRNTAKEFIIETLKETDYYNFCQDLLTGSFQKKLLPKLKKIYPLAFCDIRVFQTKEPEKIDLNKILEGNAIKKEEKQEEKNQEENEK